jgi:hypothetical protein
MQIIRIILIITLVSALHLVFARDIQKPELVLNRSFFTELARTNPILRDRYFQDKLQSIVTGKGEIVKVQEINRYRRDHLLVLKDNTAETMNLEITYHLYLSGKDFLDIIQKGELFEFRGQLISYTPANMKRDSYIIDILLEDGAMIIE